MSTTDTAPKFARIPETCRRFGLSRSRLYLLAGDGSIRFLKSGTATLVDLQSVRDYLAACPPAQVRAPKAAA
jgi:excisionase family DNA binding protein